jgi:tetratricopeptide (TPR) repeat protein
VLELLDKATVLQVRGDIEDGPDGGAVSFYKRVLSLDPENPVASASLAAIVATYRQEAIAELAAGRFQRALELAQMALVHAPGDVSSQQIFKTSLERMVQVSGATGANLVLARQLLASNKPEDARSLLREILQAEPDHEEAARLERRAQELAQQLEDRELAHQAEERRLAAAREAALEAAAQPTPEPTPPPTLTPEPPPTSTPEPAPTLPPSPEPTLMPELEPGPGSAIEGQLVELGPGVISPSLIDDARLKLPPSFVSRYRGRTIEATVLVNEDGEVVDSKIISIPQRSYSGVIQQQLQRLRFYPARVGDVRVSCWNPMRIVVQ